MSRAKWLAILWTLLILVVCWAPRQTLPINERAPSILQQIHLDKIVHAVIFAGYSYFWRRATSPRAIGLIAITGVMLAVLTELGQATSLVGRDADLWDGIADSLGVAIGLIFATTAITRSVDRNRLVREPFDAARRESA